MKCDRSRTWVNKRRDNERKAQRRMKIKNNNILSLEEEKLINEELLFRTQLLSHGGSILPADAQ